MFKNYLLITWRNILKYRTYSLVNISGLALGLACAIFVLLVVRREYSVNRNFSKAGQLYRVSSEWKEPSMGLPITALAPSGPLLVESLPEVVRSNRSWDGSVVVNVGDQSFRESMIITDPTFFEMFDFPFLDGRPETALKTPDSVVLSEGLANKFFGSTDVLGEVITFQTWTGGGVKDYQVTGVLKKMPKNSITYFDEDRDGMVISDANLEDYWNRSAFESWNSRFILTFVELTKQADVARLNTEIPALLDQHCPPQIRPNIELKLEPVTRIHLTDDDASVLKNIRVKVLLAALMIFVACINFINLTTARSMQRAKEIGLRKVMGGERKQLIKQFLSEAVIFSIFSLIVAVGLVEFFLHSFDFDSTKDLAFDYGKNLITLAGLLGVALVTGILAGSYPAFFLSTFEPVAAIKGGLKTAKAATLIRKVLVVAQFSLAVFFLASMNVMSKQLNFMLNLDLGFEQDNVLIINSAAREFSAEGVRKQAVVKNALLSVPGVAAVSFGWNLPMDAGAAVQLANPQLPDVQPVAVSTLTVDESFLDVFQMKVAQGRFFSRQFLAADSANSLVLNEFAVKALQLSSPVGSEVRLPSGQPANVVGVVQDFNISPLEQGPNRPLAFVCVYGNPLYRQFAVKLRSSDIVRSVSEIEQAWRTVNPDVPFEYEFMDQKVQAAYSSIQDLRQMAAIATGVAGFVACLGLLGLAAFTAERRTREVGIRKVLGASVLGIVRLLSKEFATLVVLASIIAGPVAYFLMNRWLEGYPSRVEVSIPTLFLAGLVALAVAVFTVSFQAVRAALSNPVETLHNE